MESYHLPVGDNEYKEVAWALTQKDDKTHKPVWIPRGNIGDHDIKFEMLYTGVCHSDVVTGENRRGTLRFPFVAGHELCGRVTEIGSKVTKHQIGDIVGVGCISDSCMACEFCDDKDENYCASGMTGTYNGTRKHGKVPGN